MTLSNPEKLSLFVRSLPDFVIYQTIDGNYNHIGATVADAVLQANLRYKTHVKPRVNRILAVYPEARTTSSVMRILTSTSAMEFLDWRGQDRAKRFSRILALFATEGIESEAELKDWLGHTGNLLKLRSIHGIGPKTVDYFKILVGVSTSAIDRHLLGFISLAGIDAGSYGEAQAVINGTADLLGIDRAYFDHSIWQYMSKRSASSAEASGCQDRRA